MKNNINSASITRNHTQTVVCRQQLKMTSFEKMNEVSNQIYGAR